MDIIGSLHQNPAFKKVNIVQGRDMKEEEENIGDLKEMESLFAGSS